MNRFVLLSSALLAVSIGSSSAVIAQSPPPAESPPVLQGMQNVQAIQQQNATGVPPADAAPGSTESRPPAQVVSAPAFISPPQPAVSGSGASLSDDDLMRSLARIQVRKAMVEAEGSLETAEFTRQKNRLAAQADLTKASAEASRLQDDPFGEKAKARDEAAKLATARASLPASAGGRGAAYAPPTLVRSIYGYGDQAYAEMVIGYDKVLATPGTVLTTGERVLSIGSNGVVVVKNGKRRTLPVSGSASTGGTVLPVSQSPSAQGLPSMPSMPPIN